MGIRKPAHFTKWANVANEIYIFVHAVAMHGGAVRQGRHLYIFKVFIEYPLNLGSGCISMHSSTSLYLVPFGSNLSWKFRLGVSCPQFVERGGRKRLEMGIPDSHMVTSYRIPIVTIGLSLTGFVVLRFVPDRGTELV